MTCGLDLAKAEHAFHVLHPSGETLERGKVENSQAGLDELVQRLEQIRTQKDCEGIVFFMEGSGHLWMTTASYLQRKGYQCRNVKNESVSHQRYLSGQPGHHSDPRDAAQIAQLGADGHFTESTLQTREPWISLRYAAREQFVLIDQMTAEKNRLHAFLETGFPHFYTIFADPFRQNSLAVLSVLPAALEKQEPEQFISSVRERFAGSRLLRRRARKVFRYVRSDDTWGYVESREALARRIALAARRLQELTREKEENTSSLLSAYHQTSYHPYIDSIEGSSPISNAMVLALLDDPALFPSSAQVMRIAGLDIGEKSSGQYQGHTRITKAGRADLRRAAMGAAMQMTRGQNVAFTRQLRYLQSRKENPLEYMQALCACAAKYLRTLWYLSVNREMYDPLVALHGKRSAKIRAQASPSSAAAKIRN